jgi:polysaccharide biosynthesis/export protein ExoF
MRKKDRIPYYLAGAARITCIFLALIVLSVAPRAADYTVHAYDKLKVRVQEWPALNGEFTVSSNGHVSFPLIGKAAVEGLRTDQIEDLISEALKKKSGYADRPFATVEVLQYLPFFILGDVQKPGEYPYHPGLTVLQAIGAAGGFFRFSESPAYLRLERDSISARGDLAVLTATLNRLLARQARLSAEIEDNNEINFPPEVSGTTAAEEQSLFATSRDGIAKRIKSFEDSRALYAQEIQSLTAQIDTVKEQQGTVERELGDVRGLRTGVLAWRELSLERTRAQILGEAQSLETLILRAKENMNRTDQEIENVRSERRLKSNTDLQTTRGEIAQTQERIQMTRSLIREAEVTAPFSITNQLRTENVRRSFLITRTKGEELQQLVVDDTALVEPGDVIEVVQRSDKQGEKPGPARPKS